MAEPLFAAFSSDDALSHNSCCEVAAHFPSVLKAVSNRLCRAVDTNGYPVDLRIDHSLSERFSGKAHKAQLQPIDHRLLRLKVDRHPDRIRFKWKQPMVLGRGLKTNDTGRYALTGKNDLALNVGGITRVTRSGIKPATDLRK